MANANPDMPTFRQKNVFVLCFDGTGNKFSGTDADSNILKLYRMLDRSDANMYTFYQPGIGTYITSHSMQTTSMVGKVRSWYMKSKDSAIGSSFAEHVMGGYKYLMRYYTCEDDLYFFGFSRGAYTARFLAEMLDHIGLLSAGNEELIRFAWKTYAKWASRKHEDSEEARKEEADMYNFMKGFRETFARPVRRIRFMGLFDTVNSVPKFESAWMSRSSFPYTARSSAKVIRHAVSIDERRAKFRQDLMCGDQPQLEDKTSPHIHRYNSDLANMIANPQKEADSHKQKVQDVDKMDVTDEDPEKSMDDFSTPSDPNSAHLDALNRNRLMSVARPMSPSTEDLRRKEVRSERINGETYSAPPRRMKRRQYSQFTKKQDIEEVWFAGGHADIGGGWTKTQGEDWMLSHAPLVWMVKEAVKAGLEFDPIKMGSHNCHGDKVNEYGERLPCKISNARYTRAFEDSYKYGVIHDCLSTGQGLPGGTVAFWKMMEYLPFRRMDLQPDGSWKAIRWPLPMGETRDIPLNAQIHHSVLKRMDCNPKYRPGNLIVGGGGRGLRVAPEEAGKGEWVVYKNQGDPILETWRRKDMYPQEED